MRHLAIEQLLGVAAAAFTAAVVLLIPALRRGVLSGRSPAWPA